MTKKISTVRKYIQEFGDPETLIADGFDDAILGLSHDSKVVYDIDKMIKVLTDDGMDSEEALEYLEFNTFGAYVGKFTPIYVQRIKKEW